MSNTADKLLLPTTPEAVGDLLPVVRVRGTLAVAVLGAVLIAGLLYLVLGRLPITVTGHAVIVVRHAVMPLESSAAGRVERWLVKPGDRVEQNQPVAVVGQPLLEKEIEALQQELAELKASQQAARALFKETALLERNILTNKTSAITDRIAVMEQELIEFQQLTAAAIEQENEYFQEREQELLQLKALETRQAAELVQRLERAQRLREKELITEEQLFAAREAVTDQRVVLARVDVRRLELNRARLTAAENNLKALKETREREQAAAALRQDLLEALADAARLDRDVADSEHQDRLERTRLQRRIIGRKQTLQENREIRSPLAGQMLELMVAAGSVVGPGSRMGTLDTRKKSDRFEVVAYFPIGAGKKIVPGMLMELSPTVAGVVSLTGEGGAQPVTGPSLTYRKLLARVDSTSQLPISPTAAALTVGSEAITAGLMGAGSRVEVIAQLQPDLDHPSGYVWAGGGTEFDVAAGTTLFARTVIKQRPPLSFVVPALKEWPGFN